MKIILHEISVRDLVNGYVDNHEEGVVGYGGKLNIRPPYQREFVYDEKEHVPVTFLDKYNPEQFEIIGSNRGVDQDPNGVYGRGSHLNGKETFKRLFIRRIIK